MDQGGRRQEEIAAMSLEMDPQLVAMGGNGKMTADGVDEELQLHQPGLPSAAAAAAGEGAGAGGEHHHHHHHHQDASTISTPSLASGSSRSDSSNHGEEEEANDLDAEGEHEGAGGAEVLLPKQRVYRERNRKIQLPVREGMNELSDDEGDGSEWAIPAPDVEVPPGYDGKRRVRPEGEKLRPDGKIKPSYYYPTEGSARGVPVFEPTIEEFKDFNSFINNIDNYGMRSGIVKIVPPKEWTNSLGSVAQPLKDTVIKDSIEQNFMGSRGLFRQSNIASRRLYNVMQWKDLCDSEKFKTPNFFNAPEEDKSAEVRALRASKRGKGASASTPAAKTTASGTTPKATARTVARNSRSARAKAAWAQKKAAAAAAGVATAGAGSPADTIDGESAAGDQTMQENREDENDVDFDTLQNPDEADRWEETLKEKSEQEQAAAAASAAVSEQHAAEEDCNVKPEEQPQLPPLLPTPIDNAFMEDAKPSDAPVAALAGPASVPVVPAVNDGPVSMPWQPLQWPLPDTSKSASTAAPGSVHVPATPTKMTDEEAAQKAQEKAEKAEASAAKAAIKRRQREEDAEKREKDWDALDYQSLPYNAKPSDFTVEECKNIEKMYWRRFTFGSPPMYGADGSGSLFDESVKDWNVAALDDLLMRINPHMPMPGVNTPYLYFGMWRATFSWHVEDADLYSINYIHFGSPKFWYSVPQAHAERFERVMAGYFPRDQQRCPEFLRHKSFLVSPTNLAKDNIPLNRVIQFPGEIVLTYPYGYHSGFNLGFNCAESINFATEGWLDIGRRARACVCLPDTVRIDVDSWLEEAREDAERIRSDPEYAEQRKRERAAAVVIPQHEARRKRELGAAYKERKAAEPPIKPRMQPVPQAAAGPAPSILEARHTAAATAPNAKAVKPKPKKDAKKKAQKAGPGDLAPPVTSSAPLSAPIGVPGTASTSASWRQAPTGGPQTTDNLTRNAITGQIGAAPPMAAAQGKLATRIPIRGYYPCALCPEPIQEGLVKVAPLQNPANIKKHGNKTLYAHKVCVTFTPTTWCAPDPVTGEEFVFGFEDIEKERWGLKCGLCADKHGTKIQCTKSAKCVRAFHATCAIKEDSGVLLDALIDGKSVLEAPKEGEEVNFGDGHLQLDVTCRQHNVAWIQAQAEKKRQELADRVAGLPLQSTVQIRTTTGIYGVTLLGHRADQGAVEIAFGDGTRALCKHGAIVWPDEQPRAAAPTAQNGARQLTQASQPHRPRPTAPQQAAQTVTPAYRYGAPNHIQQPTASQGTSSYVNTPPLQSTARAPAQPQSQLSTQSWQPTHWNAEIAAPMQPAHQSGHQGYAQQDQQVSSERNSASHSSAGPASYQQSSGQTAPAPQSYGASPMASPAPTAGSGSLSVVDSNAQRAPSPFVNGANPAYIPYARNSGRTPTGEPIAAGTTKTSKAPRKPVTKKPKAAAPRSAPLPPLPPAPAGKMTSRQQAAYETQQTRHAEQQQLQLQAFHQQAWSSAPQLEYLPPVQSNAAYHSNQSAHDHSNPPAPEQDPYEQLRASSYFSTYQQPPQQQEPSAGASDNPSYTYAWQPAQSS